MKRYGIIDIGSNTEVPVIYEDHGTSFQTLQYVSVHVHLIQYHHYGHMYEDCGVPVMCLSGNEEALCSLAGARLAFDDVRLMIDIGGGSTEFAGISGEEVSDIVSIPYGCLRLAALGYDAEKAMPLLEQMRKEHPLLTDQKVLTGVGGTLRAVEAFMMQYTDCSGGIPADKLYELYEGIQNGDLKLLDLVYSCVTEDRRPYIVPGLGMLVSICRIFHAEIIQVSPYGVREGFWMRHVR